MIACRTPETNPQKVNSDSIQYAPVTNIHSLNINPRARRTEIFNVIVYEIGSTLPPDDKPIGAMVWGWIPEGRVASRRACIRFELFCLMCFGLYGIKETNVPLRICMYDCHNTAYDILHIRHVGCDLEGVYMC